MRSGRTRAILAATGLATALAAPAAAQVPGTCQRWSFARVEDEGGLAPRAFVCPLGSNGGSFYAGCDGGGLAWFALYAGAGAPVNDPDFKGIFIIDIDGETFRRPVSFQGIDDSIAFFGEPFSGRLVAAMMAGGEIAIRLEGTANSGDDFTLAGSSAALKSLAGACARSAG